MKHKIVHYNLRTILTLIILLSFLIVTRGIALSSSQIDKDNHFSMEGKFTSPNITDAGFDRRGAGIVKAAGRLQVYGNKVCAENGDQITLAGMSFFWSQWAGEYYNADVVNYLVDNFKVSIVRAAYGVPHEGSPDGDWSKIERVVDAAIARDIYVIIDWHTEGDAWPHHEDAKNFFNYMSAKYGNYPHVIYEPWNEPISSGVGGLQDWHQDIAGVIRSNDPDNLIICGSDTWSQYPNSYTINDPNAAYTFHGYFDDPANGAVHRSQFYANVDAAMNQGSAVFVTEFGANYGENWGTSEIMDACIERGISMTAWSVNHKPEPWSIFNGYLGSLTDIGRFYQSKMTSWPPYNSEPVEPIFISANQTTKVQAEDYHSGSGVQKETQSSKPNSDSGCVGYIDTGDSFTFKLNIEQATDYTIFYRAGGKGNGQIQFKTEDGNVSGTVSAGNTGDWDSWTITESINDVSLPQGDVVVTIYAPVGGYNVDWLEFTPCTQDFTVSAGPDASVVLPINSASLDGSAFNQEGQNITYFWSQISGPSSATIVSPASEDTQVTDLIKGIYVFRLTGNNGFENMSDDVKITVNNKPDYNTVAIKSAINNQYVCAENSGNDPLLANRDTAQDWEIFDLELQSNGAYAIKSHANDMYLAVELYEGNIVKARSSSVSTESDSWELFWIEDLGNGKVAFKSNANGNYLLNDVNQGNVLKANASVVSAWEEFYLEK